MAGGEQESGLLNGGAVALSQFLIGWVVTVQEGKVFLLPAGAGRGSFEEW